MSSDSPDATTRSPSAARPPVDARRLVVENLTEATQHFPRLDALNLPQDQLDRLSDRDARLAVVIHRLVLQRWITLEHVLGAFLKKPMAEQAPELRAILLAAGAQLMFLSRVPAHAVVHESVELTRSMLGGRLTGLCNAVLRRVAEQVQAVVRDQPWSPGRDRVPLAGAEGGFLQLQDPLLPDPETRGHLAIATSHPRALVRAWWSDHGEAATRKLCLHSLEHPPTVVVSEPGFEPPVELVQTTDAASLAGQEPDAEGPTATLSPHQRRGFWLWHGSHRRLSAFLAEHPLRRAQDPGSAESVEATAGLSPALIVDYCAGSGTKSKQLAALHPEAHIVASDPDAIRMHRLRELANLVPRIRAIPARDLGPERVGDGADLLLLDVPCSNTAVLARRPEARYRFSDSSIHSLVELQRRIVQQAMPLLKVGGHLMFCTCSLDRRENEEQVTWLARTHRMMPLSSHLTLPGGHGSSYHDGSFSALLRREV